jgi:hypothetical protein
VMGLALARGVALSTPRMGERLNLASPHRGELWWRDAVDTVAAPDARGLRADSLCG